MADSAPLICKDIHKTFDQLEVLKGISLETKKGDVVSLIGSSGSGKSTFLRCINMLETPTSGDIIVHGDPIRFTTNRKGERIPADNRQVELIRARLSMVFQSFNLSKHYRRKDGRECDECKRTCTSTNDVIDIDVDKGHGYQKKK